MAGKEVRVGKELLFYGYIDDLTPMHCTRLPPWRFPQSLRAFGIVALEAMAANVPVVVSDTGGLAEIVEHGVNGLKCYPGNAESLADQIITLLKDQVYAKQLVRRARQMVEKRMPGRK